MTMTSIEEMHDPTGIQIAFPDVMPEARCQFLVTKHKLSKNEISNDRKIRLSIIPHATLFCRMG